MTFLGVKPFENLLASSGLKRNGLLNDLGRLRTGKHGPVTAFLRCVAATKFKISEYFLNNYTFSPVNPTIAFFSTVNKMFMRLTNHWTLFFFLFLCILHILVPVWELELHYNPFLSQSYKSVFITLHSYFPNNPCPQLQQQPNQMAVFSGNVSKQQVKSATRRTLVLFL